MLKQKFQFFLLALFFVKLQAGCNITGCSTCSSIYSNKCSKCKSGYYLSTNYTKCYACPIECNECTGYYDCTDCVAGYYLSRGDCKMNSDKKSYYNCPLGTYWDNYIEMCMACSNYCQSCYSYSSCSVCISGYRINSYGYCARIDYSDFSDEDDEDDEDDEEEDDSMSGGAIAGMVVGIIAGIACIIGCICMLAGGGGC